MGISRPISQNGFCSSELLCLVFSTSVGRPAGYRFQILRPAGLQFSQQSTVKITYRTERFDTMSENTGHIKIWLRVVLVEQLACCFLNNRQAHESSYL